MTLKLFYSFTENSAAARIRRRVSSKIRTFHWPGQIALLLQVRVGEVFTESGTSAIFLPSTDHTWRTVVGTVVALILDQQ